MSELYNQYLELLHEFESLSATEQSESIFDIAGYPHYENVSSNILAFFLNPHNEHKLGELLLSSLLNLSGGSETHHVNVKVNREVSTNKGSRLDIVIYTDNQIIGIENKIYHTLNNDLEDYSNSLNEWATPDQLHVVKVILSLRKEKESFGFVCVTYDEFFSKIKERLGNYVSTSSQKWLLYLIDFMSTIEKLKGDAMELDESDKFFIENEDRISTLVNARNKFLSKLYSKVIELKEKVEKPAVCERQWIYAKSCLVHDFNLSGNSIAFDLYISPKGWELVLFGRNIRSKSYLAKLFSIPPMCERKASIEDSRYILEKFGLEIDLDNIRTALIDWFSLLLQSEKNANPTT